MSSEASSPGKGGSFGPTIFVTVYLLSSKVTQADYSNELLYLLLGYAGRAKILKNIAKSSGEKN